VKHILLFCGFILFFFPGCDRNQRFDFPYVQINLSLGLYSDLGNLGRGGVLFIDSYGGAPVGVKGLIIYKSDLSDTYGNDIYMVFDRACTYEPDHSCAVDTFSEIQGVVKCTCCNSQYLLLSEGDVLKGPASHPLIRYMAFIDGGLLKIIN
jgi:Rieske Fe-S protein